MAEICVDLNISATQILRYYRGACTTVNALAADGRRVQFPISLLRPFMTHAGVAGRFVINYDDRGKFNNITQISA